MFNLAHRRGLLLAAAFVPFAVGAVLLSPYTVTEAQGCSGAYGKGMWVIDAAEDDQLGTDGWVALRAKRQSWGEFELADLTVELKRDDAQLVPGSVTSRVAGADAYYVFFKPDAPLEPNTSYTVRWQTAENPAPEANGSAELMTAAGAAVSSVPVATPIKTYRRVELDGPPTTCETPDWESCTEPTYFGSTERELVHVETSWKLPPAATSQVLKFDIAAVKGTLYHKSVWPEVIASVYGDTFETYALFDVGPEELCFDLVVLDARNDKKLATVPHCVTPPSEPATETPLDDMLSGCSNPPDDETLLPRWCSHHSGDERCKGAAPWPPADAGTNPPSNNGSNNGTAQPSSSSDSSGCQLGPRPANGKGLGWAAGLALGLLWRRRRSLS